MARQRLVRFVAVAVFLYIALLGVEAAYSTSVTQNGNTTAIVNESFSSPTAGTLITLNDSNIDDAIYDSADDITVRDENGTILTNGTDFTWFERNGTLKPLSGGDLAGDANGTVSYGYARPTNEQTLLKNIALVPMQLGDELIWLLGVAFALAALFILAQRS